MTEALTREQSLLRAAYEAMPAEWDENHDGCRHCEGNVVNGGVREAVAAAQEHRPTNKTPHDPDCIYRLLAEYHGEKP